MLLVFVITCCLLGFCIKNLLSEKSSIYNIRVSRRNSSHYTSKTDPSGKLVILAHGFAGSTVMRALVALAREGHIVIRFDFLGHGKHKILLGDVKSKNGPTRQLSVN